MKILPLKGITIVSSNIPADNTPAWDITASYLAGVTRQYNLKLYTSVGSIAQICTYIYDDSDALDPDKVTNAETLASVTNTAVPCTQNVTVVYEKQDDKYYKFTGVTGNQDFTSLDFSASGSWTDETGVNEYRNTQEIPDNSLFWFDEGFINSQKMLDASISTQTTTSGNMTIEYQIFKCDTLAFFNLSDVTSIDIIVTDNGSAQEIFNETIETQFRNTSGWYDYFTGDFQNKINILQPIQLAFDATVDVTLNGTNPKIGLLACSRAENIGGTRYGARIGLNDFSKKEVDDNGNIILAEGKFQRTNNLTIEVPYGSADNVINRLDELRATPTIYSGTDDLTSTQIFGYYRNYDLTVNLPTLTLLNIELESLT